MHKNQNTPNKKFNVISAAAVVILFAVSTTFTASANSSWHWISSTKPVDLLLPVVLVTLIIETLTINYIPKVKSLGKVFCVTAAANLVSFAFPYILEATGLFNDVGYTLEMTVEYTPFYTIGVAYLVMTLVVELPIVYFALRKHTENQLVLFMTILSSNTVTTAIVALTERFLCYGKW